MLPTFADDIAAVTKILGKEVTLEDGNKYMRTEKLLLDFNLGKSRFRIKDYLNDGNILGKCLPLTYIAILCFCFVRSTLNTILSLFP